MNTWDSFFLSEDSVTDNFLQERASQDLTTKEKDKGTGLGLSVVHGIATGYGGDIKVYSESGRGTRFTVRLPLMEKEAETESTKDAETVPRGSEHILLVDDEEPIVRLEKSMLQGLGYQVTCCTRSTDALALFKASPGAFDLVITDMTMPEMTGDQLAAALLAIKEELPVIIATGFSQRIDRDQALNMGIKGFLGKSVVRSKMGKMVRELLAWTGPQTKRPDKGLHRAAAVAKLMALPD